LNQPRNRPGLSLISEAQGSRYTCPNIYIYIYIYREEVMEALGFPY
jgi:hypothetical protein